MVQNLAKGTNAVFVMRTRSETSRTARSRSLHALVRSAYVTWVVLYTFVI